MQQNNNNIWDDSQCTVDESISSEAVSMNPKPTMKFKNSLIVNKGDISTARKISRKITTINVLKWNESNSVDSYISSNSVSSDGLNDCIQIDLLQAHSSAIEQITPLSGKPWEDFEQNQKMMDSHKILKKLTLR